MLASLAVRTREIAHTTKNVDATPTMMVDEVVDNGLPMVHVAKQNKVGVDGDDISIGSPHKGDGHAKSSEDPLGRIDMKRQPLTEAQGSKVVDDQHNQLLQMAMLCESVQKLRVQVKDGFAIGGRKRHEDNIKLTEEMSARMDEGFRNEERARRLVQNVLPVMKEEIKNLEGSGSALWRGKCKSSSGIWHFRHRRLVLDGMIFSFQVVQRMDYRLHNK